MIGVSGKNWSGHINDECPVQGRGEVDGYPWFFQFQEESCIMEIAEDQSFNCEDLPLVGYGVAGWLYEESIDLEYKSINSNSASAVEFTQKVIDKFRNNELEYIPLVSSNC